MPVLIESATTPAVPVGAYATITQARAAGATGTDAEVSAALDAAAVQVDRITGQWWDLRAASVVTQIDRDGYARLPRRVVTVTAVRVVGATVDVPPTSYRVETAATLGGRDRLRMGYPGTGWDTLRNHDPLMYRVGPDSQPVDVLVTGTYGITPTPPAISEATARLAAQSTGSPSTVNTEGDASLGSPPQVPDLTFPTGDPVVDGLLAPYLPRTVRLS